MPLPDLGAENPIPSREFLDYFKNLQLGPMQFSLLPPEMTLGSLLINRNGLTYPLAGGLLNLEPKKDGFSLLYNRSF